MLGVCLLMGSIAAVNVQHCNCPTAMREGVPGNVGPCEACGQLLLEGGWCLLEVKAGCLSGSLAVGSAAVRNKE